MVLTYAYVAGKVAKRSSLTNNDLVKVTGSTDEVIIN